MQGRNEKTRAMKEPTQGQRQKQTDELKVQASLAAQICWSFQISSNAPPNNHPTKRKKKPIAAKSRSFSFPKEESTSSSGKRSRSAMSSLFPPSFHRRRWRSTRFGTPPRGCRSVRVRGRRRCGGHRSAVAVGAAGAVGTVGTIGTVTGVAVGSAFAATGPTAGHVTTWEGFGEQWSKALRTVVYDDLWWSMISSWGCDFS